MKSGKLYGIGIGPGDPELLTFKAARLIRECDWLVVPGVPAEESTAYRIALAAVPQLARKQVMGARIPMTKDEGRLDEGYRRIADQIIEWLDEGLAVGYLTLGDVAVYSTYLPIHRLVRAAGYETELVSGVTSFCAAAARLGVGLAERGQAMHILPASYPIEEGLLLPGTKVLMKAGSQMARVKEAMERMGGCPGWEIGVVENCGLPGERAGFGMEAIRSDAGYLTLTILKDREPERLADGRAVVDVVGIGPGSLEGMTLEAFRALARCDVIIGYTAYTELLRPYFPDKEYRSTPMTREEERCRLAFTEAAAGRRVAMVCSGDAGIYGMAGLMLELAPAYPDCEVRVVSGVTAAVASASELGAPLGHDLAFISLSDRLTPWETIERRLRAAAQADLVLCLYNPSSKGRPDHLARACRILLECRDAGAVCGIGDRIGREGHGSRVMTLAKLLEAQADMFSTVIVGNSQTRNIGGRMVTPRGYRLD